MEPSYIRLKGKVWGPFSIDQLKAMQAQGRLSSFHEVSSDRLVWIPVAEVPELGAIQTPPPLPPPLPVGAPVHAAARRKPSSADTEDEEDDLNFDQPRQFGRREGGFHCPFCGTGRPPLVNSQVSTGGWVLFVVLLLSCFPLCFIGLFLKDRFRECSGCGIRLG